MGPRPCRPSTSSAEPLFWVAALTALVAATVRGFSGFGAGLIFMPVAAACFGPKVAAGVLYIIDTILILPFVVDAVGGSTGARSRRLGSARQRRCRPAWRCSSMSTRSRSAGACRSPSSCRSDCSPPAGAIAGRRAPGCRSMVGAVAGFMGGSAQIPGPPVLIYWLGRQVVSATMRANAIVFFMFTTVISGVALFIGGIFTAEVMALSLALFPALRARALRRQPALRPRQRGDLPPHRLRHHPRLGAGLDAGVRVRWEWARVSPHVELRRGSSPIRLPSTSH